MNNKKFTAFAAAALMAVCAVSPNASFVPSSVSVNSVEAYASESYTKNTEGFVKRMYNIVLGRDADPTGLRDWTNKLNKHTITAADLVYGFFWSNEYRNSNKSNSDIVDDCYMALLDRSADSAGKTNWTKHLDVGMTHLSICAGFVGSSEFKQLCLDYGINAGTISPKYARDENYERTAFVYRLYKNCLGRNPDTEGLENWCRSINNGYTGSKLAEGFIFSNEYKAKKASNSEFLDMLYNTILGRGPDAPGKESWLKRLASGNSREYVTNGFLYSTEFRNQCSTAGITLGGKIWAPEDERP